MPTAEETRLGNRLDYLLSVATQPLVHTHPGGGGGAATNEPFITWQATAGLTNDKVLGADVIMAGVVASRPAAATAGRLYYVSDAGAERITRDTGAAWTDLLHSYTYLTNIPATFTPAAHTHPASQVTSGIFASGNGYSIVWNEAAGTIALAIKRASGIAPGTGNMVEIQDQTGSPLLFIDHGGNLTSTSDITGDLVSATTFSGSGASLTNLPVGSLVGQVAVSKGGTGVDWSAAAAGTIPYFSALGTFGLISGGSNGDVITKVAGAPAWATPAAPTNAIINNPTALQEIDGNTVDNATLRLFNTQTIGGTGAVESGRLEWKGDWFTAGAATGDGVRMAARVVPLSVATANWVLDYEGTDAFKISQAGIVNMGTWQATVIAGAYIGTHTHTEGDILLGATSRIVGRKTAGAGAAEELTLSEVLDFVGSAADGDILYRSGGVWTRLPKGSASQEIRMNAGATAPEWYTPSSGGDPWTELSQAADQDVINTTFASSTNLTFSAVAGKTYHLELHIIYSGNSTAMDFKWQVLFPSSSGWYSYIGNNIATADTIAVNTGVRIAPGATNTGAIALGTDAVHGHRVVMIELHLVVASAGTVAFQFAQNTSTASVQARLKAGSKMRYRALN